MSAFSRGLLSSRLTSVGLRSQPQCAKTPFQSIIDSRSFSSAARIQANASQIIPKPTRAIPKPPARTSPPRSTPLAIPRAGPATTTAATPQTNYAFLHRLAQKGTPTILYEAPSHVWYMGMAWSTGIFCFSYAAINCYTTYLYPPEGIAWWAPHAYGVICAFMACMGMYFLMGATGIIKSIRAMPSTTATSAVAKAAKTAAERDPASASASVSKLPSLALEFQIKRLIPLRKPRTLLVPAEEVTSRSKIYKPVLYMSEQQQRAHERAERLASDERFARDKERLLTLPFRQAGRGLKGTYNGVVRALTREGFIPLNVKGQKFKLDITGGWALEDGKALDRIIKHVPE